MTSSRWWIVPPAAVAAVLVAGCLSTTGRSLPAPVATVFDQPDEVVVYALDPDALTGPGSAARELFHGVPVAGKTVVADQLARRKLFAAFRRGVTDHDGSVVAGFRAHHGLHVRADRHTVDLVISFPCSQTKVYVDGAEEPDPLLVSTSPRKAFNEVLRDGRVTVPGGGE